MKKACEHRSRSWTLETGNTVCLICDKTLTTERQEQPKVCICRDITCPVHGARRDG